MNHSSKSIWISRSWAKINLGLHVLRRLPNGYHEIDTGFCFINWADRFEMQPSHGPFSLQMSEERLPTDHTNLIVKAVHKLTTYMAFDTDWSVFVDKRIPFGAGLGGGSSNAATMTRLLEKACSLNKSAAQLALLVDELGADIPVFLHGKTAIGKGTGTQLAFHDIQPDAWIVTIFPDIHVSTADAYRNCLPDPEPDFSLEHVLLNEPVEEWRHLLVNDLEPWVIHQHPRIGDIRDQCYELGAVYSAMSGSGSSVFALFDQEFVAVDAYNQLLDWGLQANLTPPRFVPDFGIYRNS